MLKCNFYQSWQYYEVGQCIIACANSVKIVFACHQFMYVFTNVLYPFRLSPLFNVSRRGAFFAALKQYTQSAYTFLVTKGRTRRVSLKIQLPINVFDVLSMLYDCITLLLQRFSYVFTTYRLSKGHFCKSFAIFTESILASIKTKLTGSHSIRHKLDQYLLLSPSKKRAKNVNNIFALYCFQLPS